MASQLKNKITGIVSTVKEYWHTPPKGNYIPYKEVASLSGAGFGVYWTTLLASTIGLSASNFLVGASIGLKPMDLQIMLIVANLVGIPIGIFRSWYYDNHHLKGGKFLPFIRRTAVPIAVISLVFVWLPYENWEYITKAVVVEFMYLLLNIFLCFYNESYTYFQQIISPDTQERATVLSISQVIYSLAPTITNLFIPMIAGWTWGLNNIWTYRVIYPFFVVIGVVINVIFFRKVKERLILPKRKIQQVRLVDAVREVAKNKYYWIIQAAAYVMFLESGYGVVLGWSFVYANNGEYASHLGIANTVIGNAALWSMLLAPLAIKKMGKRNLLIASNSINVVVLIALYFGYKNILFICVLWYLNTFVSTFWNIVQHNINADMRDYHQWKTGVRIDGLFGPLGMIGTAISFFTGMFYPAIYEKMGLLEDYNVLYDDTMRNNLFEVLILCSAVGAFLNLVPFLFYDLTEIKHKGYVSVLKIRAMFDDFGAGDVSDNVLAEGMEIINTSRNVAGMEKQPIDKSALKLARKMPKKSDEEKALRTQAIKDAKAEIRRIEELNDNIHIAPFVLDELNKFSTLRYQKQLESAQETLTHGMIYCYTDIKQQMQSAKALPKSTKEEKEIRQDAIKLVRSKNVASKLIKKYGEQNIVLPDESVAEEIENRVTSSLKEIIKVRRDMKAYTKAVSVYNRAVAPYCDAQVLITQAQNYTHLDEIENLYASTLQKEYV